MAHHTTKPLMIDLFCGLGGWSSGGLSEGYDVIGFDITRHQYGAHRYPAQLVVQDVLTLHGSQFKDATLIVASPPCQEFSYMAMPWKLAKAKAAAIRADTTGKMLADLTRLFDACFRIQAQASLAAGHRIPMVVENVRGAIPWVGRSRWNFDSYHLWGDVPALMPITAAGSRVPGFRFDGSGSFQSAAVREGVKAPGMNWSDPAKRGQDFTRIAGRKVPERIVHIRDGAPHPKHLTNGAEHAGVKHHGSGAIWFDAGPAALPSASRRKEASAMIAKIPLPLAQHVAAMYR